MEETQKPEPKPVAFTVTSEPKPPEPAPEPVAFKLIEPEPKSPEPKSPEPKPPEPAAEPVPAGKNGLLHALSAPLTSNGKTLEALNLDFDKLKVKGLKAVAQQFRAQVKEWVAVNYFDERYQLMCVARLNGIIYEDLDSLGAADGVRIMGAARDFFVEKEK